MQPSLQNFSQLWVGVSADSLIKAIILIIAGFLIAKILSRTSINVIAKHTSISPPTWIGRSIFYLVLFIFVISALQHLGFKLNVFLGAAGILTVALGFASQTSVSNIISGLFLIAEKPFGIGDTITIGNNTTGEVLSIDLLSLKIRTNNNTLVRIPNETLIKSEINNLTRFPIRRFDLQIGVAYKEDLAKVRKILLTLGEKNPRCLEEPKPFVAIIGFGDSAINIQFSTWASKENFAELKNTIQEEVKKAFDTHHIEMPFPQLSISTASITEPFPVKTIES